MSARKGAHAASLRLRAEESLEQALRHAQIGDLASAKDFLDTATRSLRGLEFLHGPESTTWASKLVDGVAIAMKVTA